MSIFPSSVGAAVVLVCVVVCCSPPPPPPPNKLPNPANIGATVAKPAKAPIIGIAANPAIAIAPNPPAMPNNDALTSANPPAADPNPVKDCDSVVIAPVCAIAPTAIRPGAIASNPAPANTNPGNASIPAAPNAPKLILNTSNPGPSAASIVNDCANLGIASVCATAFIIAKGACIIDKPIDAKSSPGNANKAAPPNAPSPIATAPKPIPTGISICQLAANAPNIVTNPAATAAIIGGIC